MNPTALRLNAAACWALTLLCTLCMVLGSGGSALAQGLAATASAAPAALRVRWEVERTVFDGQGGSARSQAVLSLTNLGAAPIPAQGWALYFSCIAGVHTGPVAGGYVLEQVVGTLFRLRPAAGAAPVASGQTLQIRMLHDEVMHRLDKAPQAPYLVHDAAPEVGHRVAEFDVAMPTRADQLQHRPGDTSSPFLSPQTIFQRNAAISEVAVEALPPVFPTPAMVVRRPGVLRWTAMPKVQGPAALRREIAQAESWLRPHFSTGGRAAGPSRLMLRIAPIADQESPEAHELRIDSTEGVTLTGASAAGVARGLQSLRQLLPAGGAPQAQGLSLPELTITDAPRFEFRGLLMDVARNFQPKATVMRLLDLMARYKLNKLHFHLTDDEGWRLAIRGLPELTDFGARRGHTPDGQRHLPTAHGSGPDLSDAHGSGHYSRADYLEILRHAAALHIEVIPEIEMPGHARAAVKAMAARAESLKRAGDAQADRVRLADPADASKYRSPQLHTDHLMDPGMPGTYAFIEQVTADVVAMHREAGVPLRSLHVGADEIPTGAWEKSPASMALMARLKITDTADLWNHFYDRVDAILRKHGLQASGWEELGARKVRLHGQGKLIPNPHFVGRGFRLFVWNDLDDLADLAYRLANAGYATVLAPATHLYFDMAHNANPDEPGVNWAAITDLDKVFDFVPFDFLRKAPTDPRPTPGLDGLTDFGRRHVLGLEGTLFAETVRDRERMDYLLMPRLLALAERAWAADPAWARTRDAAEAKRLHAAAWSQFVHQVGRQVLPRLDADGAGIHYRIPAPGLMRVDGQVHFNAQIPGFELRYTTDGREPTSTSTLATGPIRDAAPLRAALFNQRGRRGAVSFIDNR